METNNSNSKKKRPVLVWVISIFYLFSFAWTTLSFFLIFSGVIPLPPEQEAYFNNLTTFDYGYTFLLMGINLAGAISLFLLRKIALYLFVGGLAISILSTIWHILTKGWLQAVGSAGLTGSLIGYVISIAICIYIWKLTNKGVLT